MPPLSALRLKADTPPHTNDPVKENLDACPDLQGWRARISYRPAADPANPGEMMAVVLVKE